MKQKISLYLTACMMIMCAVLVIIYKSTTTDILHENEKLFPNIQMQKNNFKKIIINHNGQNNIFEKNMQNQWIISSQSGYPVNQDMLNNLFSWLDSAEMISAKTKNPDEFKQIGLISPDKDIENKNGVGTRLTFYTNSNRPDIDIIVGDILQAYVMPQKQRFFMRSVFASGAYLLESDKIPSFELSNFISDNKILPAPDNVQSMTVYTSGNTPYMFHYVPPPDYKNLDDKNNQDIIFMPTSVPQGYKLIYPQVATDYVRAVLKRIRPVGVQKTGNIPMDSKNFIDIKTKKGDIYKILFYTENEKFFMTFISNAMPTEYIYEISKKDFLGVLQPLPAFLTKENMFENAITKKD